MVTNNRCRHCSHCGQIVYEGNRYCSQCGKPLFVAEQPLVVTKQSSLPYIALALAVALLCTKCTVRPIGNPETEIEPPAIEERF
ncbi:MAG: zinc ribbon domain-containing protein [Clostridiales bacterium]|nr:zinc ribbon domain-containing protein [Clostridiales bacterium]